MNPDKQPNYVLTDDNCIIYEGKKFQIPEVIAEQLERFFRNRQKAIDLLSSSIKTFSSLIEKSHNVLLLTISDILDHYPDLTDKVAILHRPTGEQEIWLQKMHQKDAQRQKT